MKRVPTTKSYAFVSRFGGWTEGIRPAFQCLAGVAGLMLGLAATPAQAAPEITVQRFGGQTFVDNDAHDDQLNDGTVFLQARAVNVGTDRVTIEIRNDGTTDLTGISVGLSGADADQFALNTDDLVTTLSPAQTTTFDIDFAPTRTGRFSVQLAIQSNDGDESPFDLLVRGEGVDLPDPTLVVDLADDEDDGNFGAGDLSFREALKLADAAPDLTTILFSPRLNGVPISPENHDWNVGSAVNIVGNGAPATILDGQNLLRVLSFQDQGGLAYDATIQGVTIRNGNASDGPGGGLYSTIRLTVADCLVTNNTSQSGDGGGIFNFGNLTVTGSTIASNSAPAGNGGGIEQGNGTLTLQNSTVTGNSANNGGGINQNGNGAILNGTIVSNTAATSGGGLRINGGAPSLDNTIVAGNTATGSPSDILIPFGNFASGSGHNLIGDPATAGGLGHGTDGNILGDGSGGLLAVGGIVDPLGQNGGFTPTHHPASGSPALDNGDNTAAAALTTDQRGASPRANGGAIDIGAVESGATVPPAEISVLDPDGNELTDGAGGLDFPLTVTGGSRPFTVTIWNLGASDLASLSVRIAGPDAGDFTEEVGGMATTLNPLTSTTFTVTFSPTTPGAKTASLTIASNDADENPFDIALSGDAIAPPPATLLVESSGDTDDGNYGPGNLSLREAIILANLLPDATTINFDSGPITLGSALPAIATETSIVGFGAVSNIVDGGGSARVFTVDDGNAGMAIPVTISGLTIRNGLGAPGENGGGIFNAEMLTISECVIADNHARGPGNEGSPFGGGIYSTGSLFVERSTISGNVCDSVGGGIFAAGPITTIWNSTVSGNSAATAGGVAIAGLSGPIDAHILNSTLVENTGGSQLFGGPFGGLTVFGANAILDNSIVAGNSEDGAPGDIVVQSGGTLAGFNNLVGHLGTAGGLEHGTDGNILGNGSGGLRALGAIVGPLSNLGGGTTVRPLVSGSPAIDHGDNIKAADLTTDQRGTGFDRVVGGTVDIGAFERGAGTGGGNTPPSVTLTGANPLTFEAASRYTDPGATAFDLEDGNRTPRITANDVNPRVPGAYSVTWTATDSGGLTGTATRTVNVVDTTPPVIANRKTVTANATSAAGATVNFTLPGATDIVGVTSIVASPPSGSQFPIGTTPVSVTAMDAAGNTSMSTFDVVVRLVDGSPPVIRLTSPTGRSLTGTYDLTGTLTENIAMTSFTVTVNGVVRTLDTDPLTGFAPKTPMPFAVNGLDPENGPNRIVIEAVDLAGRVRRFTKTVNFVNSRPELAGIHDAFIDPAGTPDVDTAGRVLVTVRDNGLFTGRVYIGKSGVSFRGFLKNDGTARFLSALEDSLEIALGRGAGRRTIGFLSFVIDAGTGMSGDLDDQAGGGGSTLASFAGEVAPHSNTNPVPDALLNVLSRGRLVRGNYNAVFGGKAQTPVLATNLFPQGDGFARIFLDRSGLARVSGYLADGARYTASGRLRKDDSLVLFNVLYARQGLFGGEVDFSDQTDSDLAGTDLLWIRNAQTRSPIYPAGWPNGVRVDTVGTFFQRPDSLDFGQGAADTVNGNANLIFADGLLSMAVTHPVSIDPLTGRVVPVPAGTRDYRLGLSAGSGQFSGYFNHDGGYRATYRGILLSKGANKGGFGFFLSRGPDGESGGVSIAPPSS